MRTRNKRPQPLQWVRHGVQTVVAVYVLAVVIGNTAGERWAANLHTICPLGGVVNIYTYLEGGDYVAKLHSAVFVMLLALVIGLILTGKSFCGWICPLGSIQQALGWIGRRLWPRAYNKVPRTVERVLHCLKWPVLGWVLVQTARSGSLVFQDWDPYYNLYHIWSDEIAISGYAVTGATLILSLLIPRPFCRYACPLGAFNGIFNSFSFMTIKRDTGTCTNCGRCTNACPVNIDICATTTVWSVECTRCLKCIDACPLNNRTGDTLRLHTWFGRTSPSQIADTAGGRVPRASVPTALFAAIAIAAFVLPILITNLTGDFATSGGRGQGGGGGGGVEKSESDDGAGVDGGVDGAGGGQELRGKTTLAEIEATGADLAAFFKEFGIPRETPLDTTLGDLTDRYGLEMSEVRAFLDQAAR